MSLRHISLVVSDKSCILLKFDFTKKLASLVIFYLLCSTTFDRTLCTSQISSFLIFHYCVLLPLTLDSSSRERLGCWKVLHSSLKMSTACFSHRNGIFLYGISYFPYDTATITLSCSLHYMSKTMLWNFVL